MKTTKFTQVYTAVRKIPHGKVATYGQIALMLGWANGARTVGWALRALASTPTPQKIPWYRVVNAQGRISLREGENIQRALLEAEGVIFDENQNLDLKVYRWIPKEPLNFEAAGKETGQS